MRRYLRESVCVSRLLSRPNIPRQIINRSIARARALLVQARISVLSRHTCAYMKYGCFMFATNTDASGNIFAAHTARYLLFDEKIGLARTLCSLLTRHLRPLVNSINRTRRRTSGRREHPARKEEEEKTQKLREMCEDIARYYVPASRVLNKSRCK